MSIIRRYILTVAVLFCTALSATLQAAETTAEAAVDNYISTLLENMQEIKPLYAADPEAYFAAVEAELSEFVDFSEVARGVMAKYGTGPNGATPEQLERFAGVFRDSLVDFYGSALANYGGVDFEIIPATTPPSDPENATNVRMSIKADDGSRFEVQYTMFLNDKRQWMLKNLYVEGVNLRRQYYSQFDSLMVRNDFDIDKVIDSWQVAR